MRRQPLARPRNRADKGQVPDRLLKAINIIVLLFRSKFPALLSAAFAQGSLLIFETINKATFIG